MLIAVYNWSAYSDEAITGFETVVKEVVQATLPCGAQETCFTFPQDPSVTSDDVPIFTVIDFFEAGTTAMARLAMAMEKAFMYLGTTRYRDVQIRIRNESGEIRRGFKAAEPKTDS